MVTLLKSVHFKEVWPLWPYHDDIKFTGACPSRLPAYDRGCVNVKIKLSVVNVITIFVLSTIQVGQ